MGDYKQIPGKTFVEYLSREGTNSALSLARANGKLVIYADYDTYLDPTLRAALDRQVKEYRVPIAFPSKTVPAENDLRDKNTYGKNNGFSVIRPHKMTETKVNELLNDPSHVAFIPIQYCKQDEFDGYHEDIQVTKYFIRQDAKAEDAAKILDAIP